MKDHKFETTGYRELANGINEACEWLSDHGLDCPRTRVGEYKRHLNELADYWEQGKVDELLRLRDFSTLINSCHEASELSNIFKGLVSLADQSIVKKLQEFIKGPVSCLKENASSSSNRGRNIAFELNIAARFATAGFTIDLTKEADIIVYMLDYEVFVECKRPQHDHQINSNIKGALSQLKRRYLTAKNPELARGIIAVAIGKVFNPNMLLIEASTPEYLSQKLSSINKAFIDQYEPKWRNPSDGKTIGALVYLGIPAEIKNLKMLANCHEIAVKTTFSNDFGIDILTEIKDRIHPYPVVG